MKICKVSSLEHQSIRLVLDLQSISLFLRWSSPNRRHSDQHEFVPFILGEIQTDTLLGLFVVDSVGAMDPERKGTVVITLRFLSLDLTLSTLLIFEIFLNENELPNAGILMLYDALIWCHSSWYLFLQFQDGPFTERDYVRYSERNVTKLEEKNKNIAMAIRVEMKKRLIWNSEDLNDW